MIKIGLIVFINLYLFINDIHVSHIYYTLYVTCNKIYPSVLKIKLPQILKHLFYIWIFFLEKDVYGNLTTKLDGKRDDFFIFFFGQLPLLI